jgi:hypothetical protein
MAKPLPAVPEDPRDHARKIAEAVDVAWHNDYGGSRIEIPISVVAALALVGKADPDGRDPTAQALLLDREGFGRLLRDIWCQFAILRPDLLPRVKPLFGWLDEDPDETVLRSAQAAGRAALKAGQLELTGVAWRRQEIDLLGIVLQSVRARSARKGLGQFLSPQGVCDVVGDVLVGEVLGNLAYPMVAEGKEHLPPRLLEPCAGTGTMLLGAAKAMRSRGQDPTSFTWYANDIDWLAAALLAVNTHLWGLGPNVLIGCGDGLTDDWLHAASKERAEAIAEVQRLWQQARMFAAVKTLFGPAASPEPSRPRETNPEPASVGPAVAASAAPSPAASGPVRYRQARLF